jgi:TonB-linked SusC/RagA family outer membrane protein
MLMAQSAVSGKVTDENGVGLPGVNVLVKGTSTGASTDASGFYRIGNVDPDAVLVFTFIGYRTQEVAVNSQTTIDVAMEPDIQALQEVVVVGYGTMLKKDVSTSIAKVDPAKVPAAANENISQLLFGRAPGLQVSQSSSQPGGAVNLSIRGRGTPLIVVDGVIMPSSGLEPGTGVAEINSVNRGGLAGLSPSDIESIEILKDASAAIYGVNAGNGVILITTKKGKEGTMNVTYNANRSWVRNMDYLEPIGGREYMILFNQLKLDKYLAENDMEPFGPNPAAGFTPQFTDEQIANATLNTDWLGEILRNGSIDNHNIAINGGAGKVRYYFSGNFFNQVGTMKNSDMTKYTGRMNVALDLNKYLTFTASFNAARNSFTNSGSGQQTGGAGANAFNALQAALAYPRYLPIRDENGKYTQFQLTGNPVSLLDIDDKTKYSALLSNFAVDINIIPEVLTAKLMYGNNYEFSERNFYIPSTVYWMQLYRSRGSLNQSKRQNQTMEATLAFKKEIADGISLDAVAGVAQYQYDEDGFGLLSTDMLDAIGNTNVASGTGVKEVNSYKIYNRTRSYFARASVDFLDRYIISGVIRYDGFSNFFPDNKYAAFPSGSVAWKISNEPFFSDVEFIDLLKLRASIGTTGTNTLAGLAAYGGFIADPNVISFNNGAANYVPYYLYALDNPNLLWQKTINKNIGLDVSLFSDRISLAFDVFRDDDTNLLKSNANTPALSFISSQAVNGGHTVKAGYEIGLTTANLRGGAFEWNTTINLSHYKYEWKERFEEDDLAAYVRVDDPVLAIYAFETNGILQLGQEVPAWQPANASKAGAPLFVDQNGDEVLDEKDVIMYDRVPKLSVGFGNTFMYRNFDLTVFLYGQFGAYDYNYSLAWADPAAILGGNQSGTAEVRDVWTSANPNGTLPGGTYNEASLGLIAGSDYLITKKDFVRARNITLGYNFNPAALNNVVKGLRVYLDVQNAFLITDYKGADPEVLAPAVKGGPAPYPMARTFSFGVSANF